MTWILQRAAHPPMPSTVRGFEHIRRHWDPALACWTAKILPGEYYVTRENEAITTVLGSCISACIRDPESGCGGMNHFMLPEDSETGSGCWNKADGGASTRYGSYAMECLINELVKLGAVGDICLHFFDKDGRALHSSLEDRVIGITLEQLRGVRRVVGVAGGHRKVDAILGALRGALIDVLITARFTAEKLVAHGVAEPKRSA